MDRGSTAIAEWFEQLGRRGHVPALDEVSGTIRFDLRSEQGIAHWLVAIRDGNVQVSRENRPANCIVHSELATFDQLATGQLHQLPAWLRHLYRVEGEGWLFRVFANVFPGPAGARHPRDFVSHARRR